MAENLVSALHAEITRARTLLAAYAEIGPAGYFGHMVVLRAIQAGEEAVRSGDPVEMVFALERLRGCTA